MRKVLISAPGYNSHLRTIELPIIWGILKTHCDQIDQIKQNYEWLEPIYRNIPLEYQDLQTYSDINVLGLSCYCWNTEYNLTLAKKIKQSNPNCFIIAGGPDIDRKNSEFFIEHPYVDCVVKQDGEIPFSKILLQLLHENPNIEDIPGLLVRDDENRFRDTGPAELLKSFPKSHLVENNEMYQKIVRDCKANEQIISLALETDRGCPYKCSFCDWGSSTNSKVRRFEIERVREELEWIGKNKIDHFYLTNANFGIFPQDIDVCNEIVKVKQKYNYPDVISWNTAKSSHKRIVEISKTLYENNVIDHHTVSQQTTDSDVIQAMSRKNIKDDNQIEIIQELKKAGVPLLVQFICGAPGDTPTKFRKTMTDMMEWGAHDEYIVYGFQVLPNAPAATPEYIEKWGIHLDERYTRSKRRRDALSETSSSMTKYITACKTFTRTDYLDMQMFGRLLIALHNGDVTRKISQYLRLNHNVTYFEFYSELYDHFFAGGDSSFSKMFHQCRNHMKSFLDGSSDFEERQYPRLPKFNLLSDVEDIFLAECILNKKSFFSQLKEFVRLWFNTDSATIDDLLEFSSQNLIDPFYNVNEGRTIKVRFDWVDYFKDLTDSEPFNGTKISLNPLQGQGLIAKDTACGPRRCYDFEWQDETNQERKLTNWYTTIIGPEYQRAQRASFKDYVMR